MFASASNPTNRTAAKVLVDHGRQYPDTLSPSLWRRHWLSRSSHHGTGGDLSADVLWPSSVALRWIFAVKPPNTSNLPQLQPNTPLLSSRKLAFQFSQPAIMDIEIEEQEARHKRRAFSFWRTRIQVHNRPLTAQHRRPGSTRATQSKSEPGEGIRGYFRRI